MNNKNKRKRANHGANKRVSFNYLKSCHIDHFNHVRLSFIKKKATKSNCANCTEHIANAKLLLLLLASQL
jgi:hypothetical protein